MSNGVDNKVGYRSPPKATRFKPGQSGNPRGRPRGTKNFKTDVQSALRARVRVNLDGKQKNVTSQEAILLRLCEQALGKGNLRAIERLLELGRIYNDEESIEPAEAGLAAEDEEILRAHLERKFGKAESKKTKRPTQKRRLK